MRLQSPRDFLRLIAERFTATDCPQVAGSLTFTTLLSLVPLVTVTIGIFSGLPGIDRLGESLRDFLLNNLLPERAGNIVATYALQFSQKAARLTLIGIAMLAVTALMLLSTIERVFNQIWGVRRPRPLLLRITVYWFVLTLGPVILGGSIVATGYVAATSVAWSSGLPWIGEIAARLLPPVLLGGLFTFLYYAVPNHPVRVLHALAGGIAAALAFLLMQRAFGMFITHFPTYTLIYGTFAALPIFLVWMYLSWIVVLLGALVSASLPTFLERQRIVPTFAGDRAWAATVLLVALAEAQRAGQPANFDELLGRIGLAEHNMENLLGTLREIGWAARTEEGYWVLPLAAEQIKTSAIIERFALDADAWLAASANTPAGTLAHRLRAGLRDADPSLAELATCTANAVEENVAPGDLRQI